MSVPLLRYTPGSRVALRDVMEYVRCTLENEQQSQVSVGALALASTRLSYRSPIAAEENLHSVWEMATLDARNGNAKHSRNVSVSSRARN
ncbi:hypothetical protein X777_12053 [Ooceraea biroi]|uniref:Uncharacterized protein n=1 Tax=Ooceraea biroi TaxID=2015173 RepID=A0A026X009_OOCBI|nr:hypothetical protein X777_12053 [Ooceraea biroi]